MYCLHYNFSEKPFDVTPDPRFLYLTKEHRETLASIIYGIQERRGFIAIIGEVGTGKTTLLHAALDRLDKKTRVAFIFNTDTTFDQMLAMALYEWRLVKPKEKLSKVKAIQRLNKFAIDQMVDGANVVLIIDEAQNLDNRTMENLRLLSNLETRRHKLIQIVLSGQPELDSILGRHDLRQLAQRISLRRYVSPLAETDTYAYLRHRLQLVSYTNSLPFTDKAQELIWEYSGGVPRRINILCDNAFLIGYGLKKNKINSAIVQEAAQDLKWQRFSEAKSLVAVPSQKITGFSRLVTRLLRPPFKVTTAIIVACILIFSVSFVIIESAFQSKKFAGYTRRLKGTYLATGHPDPIEQNKQLWLSETFSQAHIAHDNVTSKAKEKELEPQIRTMTDEVSSHTTDGYHGLNKKSHNPTSKNSAAKDSWLLTSSAENDRSEPRLLDEERSSLYIPEGGIEDKKESNLTISVKEDAIIRQITVKKGDTLYRIIVRTYGSFDNTILHRVQQLNPKIKDPGTIRAGQIIKLPAVKE